jgi:hypothetical protein
VPKIDYITGFREKTQIFRRKLTKIAENFMGINLFTSSLELAKFSV